MGEATTLLSYSSSASESAWYAVPLGNAMEAGLRRPATDHFDEASARLKLGYSLRPSSQRQLDSNSIVVAALLLDVRVECWPGQGCGQEGLSSRPSFLKVPRQFGRRFQQVV